MAESTLNPNALFLYDLFPGPITYTLPPADETGDVFGNTSHCNVASPAFKLGTKVAVYESPTDGTTVWSGWSIMTYLRFQDGGDTTPAIGDMCCCIKSATSPLTDVSQDGDSAAACYGPYAAVAVLAMTDAYYGWFWTGGVCPYLSAPDLSGDTTCIVTATNDVAAGEALTLADAGTAAQLGVDNVGTLTTPIIGQALTADA
jgi:hypothetical protein